MKRPNRLRDPRLLRRDWAGDAALTLVAGGVLLAGVLLPWVNDDAAGWVNFSFSQGGALNGVLQTRWGAPALVLALMVVGAGMTMLFTRPRRFSILLGALVAVAGGAVFFVAQDAATHIGYLDPGVGMYLTALVGVLLVPIGIAAALVAWLIVRAERSAAGAPPPAVTPAGAPPAPPSLGNAPPS